MKKKKLFYAIISLIVIIFLTSLVIVKLSNHGTYKEITFEQLEKKLNNKESFILFIGATSCSHCNDYKLLIKGLKHKVTFYYIDLELLTVGQSDWIELKYNVTGTPLTQFIKDGESVDYISGANYTKLMKKLINNGYIKDE